MEGCKSELLLMLTFYDAYNQVSKCKFSSFLLVNDLKFYYNFKCVLKQLVFILFHFKINLNYKICSFGFYKIKETIGSFLYIKMKDLPTAELFCLYSSQQLRLEI